MTSNLSTLERVAQSHRKGWGEYVSFRGDRLLVTLNHNPKEQWANGEKSRKAPRFLPEAFSTVRVLNDSVDPMPRIGEVFTEETGQTHRIQYIQTCRLSYLCFCAHTAP